MLDAVKHVPKIIIIEGCDRLGKDTLISKLSDHYRDVKVIHATVPTSKDLFNFYYNGLIHETLGGYYDHSLRAVIHNRSIYGEYVYGPKYRDESREDVADMIYKLEVVELRTFVFSADLYFILLTSSSSDLIIKNDDGLSLSSKRSDIEDELLAFNDIFDKSTIENKKRIFVNDGDNFRDDNKIYEDVLKFITRA